MGGGEILRMILADSKSYMQQNKENPGDRHERQRPQTSQEENQKSQRRNKPRDISELDQLIMGAMDE